MHIFRPLILVVGLVVVLLAVRAVAVPGDFGVQARGYIYGWHRAGSEEDLKSVKVKYQGANYCENCHGQEYTKWSSSSHALIQCENCHGPAIDHPSEPPQLEIDTSRDLCLRCHSYLPYDASGRKIINGIDPNTHNINTPCVSCHNPHSPG